jgi:YHS domain-containing protein
MRSIAAILAAAWLACGCTSSKPTTGNAAQPSSTAQSQPTPSAPSAFDAPPAPGTIAKCPVSGEVFTVKASTERSEHGGKHYAFCCPDCKPDFDKDPAKYTQR